MPRILELLNHSCLNLKMETAVSYQQERVHSEEYGEITAQQEEAQQEKK